MGCMLLCATPPPVFCVVIPVVDEFVVNVCECEPSEFTTSARGVVHTFNSPVDASVFITVFVPSAIHKPRLPCPLLHLLYVYVHRL